MTDRNNNNNNNGVEVVKFATSENLPCQVCSHIAAFVNARERYVIWKDTVKLIITNMVDFNNASLSSLQSDQHTSICNFVYIRPSLSEGFF